MSFDRRSKVLASTATACESPRDTAVRVSTTPRNSLVHLGAFLGLLVSLLINCAGNVADGERFVSLVDRVIASVESLPSGERPVCWLLEGPHCSISMLRVAAASNCTR